MAHDFMQMNPCTKWDC